VVACAAKTSAVPMTANAITKMLVRAAGRRFSTELRLSQTTTRCLSLLAYFTRSSLFRLC
jgi:hypothetical protein